MSIVVVHMQRFMSVVNLVFSLNPLILDGSAV